MGLSWERFAAARRGDAGALLALLGLAAYALTGRAGVLLAALAGVLGVWAAHGVARLLARRRGGVASPFTALAERYGALVDLAPDAIATVALDGSYTSLNPAFERLTGWKRADWVGRRFEDTLHPDDLGTVRSIFAHVLEGGNAPSFEARFRTASGAYLTGEVHAAAEQSGGVLTGVITVTRDVTERKDAERALREHEEQLRKSEEKFEKAFRLNPNVMLITRLADGAIVDVNDAWLSAMGYAREEAIGRSSLELIWRSAEERDAVVEPMRAHGRVIGVQAKTRTKSGLVRDSLVSAEIISLDGEPHVLVAAKDVTEENRVTAALRESEERFRELIEELGVGVAVLDRDLRVVLANRAALVMLGVRPEQLVGRVPHAAPFESINEDGVAMTPEQQPSRIAVATKQPVRHVVMGRRKVGEPDWTWYLVDAVPQLDQQGEVRRIIITFHDITDRRRAEERQRELHEALRAAASDWTQTFDAFEAPALILAADGAIRRLNRAARDLAGKTSFADLVNRPIAEVADGEPWATMVTLARQVGATGESVRSQVRESDPLRAWYATATPIPGGREERVVVVARDVTDFVELQESLRRTETMSALGAVVAGVAHEVRNPLFAISATVDAFDARFGAQPEHGRYFKALRQEVNRLSELMAALLEYGRPPMLEVAEHDLGDVVRRAVEHCRSIAERQRVHVEVQVPESVPRLRMDATRMLQVFQNLIENAIQHSPADGVVAVGASQGRERGAAWVEVAVLDQGMGFREDDLPHVFQPFFTRRHGGTGLGLSIVQRIVEQHGGQVRASNRPEGGAAMTVRLRQGVGRPS